MQATWSTGCPKPEDIRVGAPGAIARQEKKTEEKEGGRLDKKGVKRNKKKKNKINKIIFKDSDHNVEISLDQYSNSYSNIHGTIEVNATIISKILSKPNQDKDR